MNLKKVITASMCSLALAGGVALATTSNFNIQSANASTIAVENTIRIYVDLSWSGVTEVHLTDSNLSMSTTSDHQQFDSTYGTYALDIESEEVDAIKLYFVQNGTYWHPDTAGNKSYNQTSKVEGTFVPGHAYQVTDIAWAYEYDDMTNKWFTYTINDLGELNTVSYKMVFEIEDVQQEHWVMDTEKIYFKTNSEWSTSSPRYAAYCYGNGTDATWYDLTSIEGEPLLFQFDRPSEEYSSIIICRMKPDALENTWDNKWNQTANLTFSSDINYYKLGSGWEPSVTTSDVWQINQPVESEFAIYTWQGSDKQLGEWPGAALNKISEFANFTHTEGTTLYVFEANMAPQANFIVSITNSNLSSKPQTITVATTPVDGKVNAGYKIAFDNTAETKAEPTEWAEGIEAYLFMRDFGALTEKRSLAEGNICEADPELRTAVLTEYSNLSAETKTIVDSSLDVGAGNETTVGQTMAWLIQRYGGVGGTNSSIFNRREKTTSIIAIIIISLASLTALGYLFIRNKKLKSSK